jgi:hypothetical protein
MTRYQTYMREKGVCGFIGIDNIPAVVITTRRHLLMAGAGIKNGFPFGETDDKGYHRVQDKVHVHDLQATIRHLPGFEYGKLTCYFQGRPFRLAGVAGKVIRDI